ncbi:Holliday junction resolvase RuvX [Planctomonas psychrotolerans]|uniref:Holliday junction resolvase RuvX n=1 Tax=Planctomonas psychrotolerans TaxID=2528712 RepID=UPI001D0CF3C2|nr:Holliday junction resolvase RuvX [Planctomonas psychrotolerans]
MRRGVRIGVDVGKARIGLARCDPSGMLATPLSTVARAATGDADLAEIRVAADEADAIEFVVGLPLSMSGARTPSTEDAVAFAERLAAAGGRPVRLVDERLSTVTAQAALHRSGRNTRSSRSVIDQVAAVIILQHALDSERAGGLAPGSVLSTEGP